jgi:hypothetical protein
MNVEYMFVDRCCNGIVALANVVWLVRKLLDSSYVRCTTSPRSPSKRLLALGVPSDIITW